MARIARPLGEMQPADFRPRQWQDLLGSALAGLGMLLLMAVPLLLLAGLASLLLVCMVVRVGGEFAYRRLIGRPMMMTDRTR